MLLACNDGTAPVYPDPCSGPVQVSVAAGVAPVISWSPDCGISELVVSAVAASRAEEVPVWAFTVSEQEPVASGVTYGKAPARATTWHAAEDLVVGTTYRASVIYTVGRDVQVAGGAATFTR
jgi:hypothetical protein